MYRELDAVWQPDPTTIVLAETKLTSEAMQARLLGRRKLRQAQEILVAGNEYGRVLLRLIYISELPFSSTALPAPIVGVDDVTTPFGVILVPCKMIEKLASECGVTLPRGWRESEVRGQMTMPGAGRCWQSSGCDDIDESPFAAAFRRAAISA
jgi:hypothetical protein